MVNFSPLFKDGEIFAGGWGGVSKRRALQKTAGGACGFSVWRQEMLHSLALFHFIFH